MIEFIAFILEHGCFAEYSKAVGKAFGDEELAVVFFGQFHGYVLTVSWGAFSDVNGNIQD